MIGGDNEIIEKMTQLKNQLSEQKSSNVQLSRQLISVTDKLAEKDSQLLQTESQKLELDQMYAKVHRVGELEKTNAELIEFQTVQKSEILSLQNIVNKLQKDVATGKTENERYIEEIIKTKTSQAGALDEMSRLNAELVQKEMILDGERARVEQQRIELEEQKQ